MIHATRNKLYRRSKNRVYLKIVTSSNLHPNQPHFGIHTVTERGVTTHIHYYWHWLIVWISEFIRNWCVSHYLYPIHCTFGHVLPSLHIYGAALPLVGCLLPSLSERNQNFGFANAGLISLIWTTTNGLCRGMIERGVQEIRNGSLQSSSINMYYCRPIIIIIRI